MCDVSFRNASHMAISVGEHVRKSVITTNNGKKKRVIYAPTSRLKYIHDMIRRSIILPVAVPDDIHGFVIGKGSATNASAHTGKGLVVNMDLRNFFPSISSRRVYGFWFWMFHLMPENERMKAASMFTSITTFDDHLCQGFSTSPDIANRIAWRLDLRLRALAKSKGIEYTRYADDLTFSFEAYSGNCRWLIEATKAIAIEEGFEVHKDKIAIMRPHRRQTVTGLVVNKDSVTGKALPPRVPRRELKRIRAMCDKGLGMRNQEDMGHVLGWLAYIESVQPDKAAELRSLLASRIENPKKIDGGV